MIVTDYDYDATRTLPVRPGHWTGWSRSTARASSWARTSSATIAADPPNRFKTIALEGDTLPEYGAAVTKDGEDVGVLTSPALSPILGTARASRSSAPTSRPTAPQVDVAMPDGSTQAGTVDVLALYDPKKSPACAPDRDGSRTPSHRRSTMTDETPLTAARVARGARRRHRLGGRLALGDARGHRPHGRVRGRSAPAPGSGTCSPPCKYEVTGPDAGRLIQRRFTNSLAGMQDGQVRYGAFVNADGLMIDDGNVYKHADDKYWVMINTADIEDWFRETAGGLDAQDRAPHRGAAR